MFSQVVFQAVATDRIARAHGAAELHRLRVTLRSDQRSLWAVRLHRLAARMDRGPASVISMVPEHRLPEPVAVGLRWVA